MPASRESHKALHFFLFLGETANPVGVVEATEQKPPRRQRVPATVDGGWNSRRTGLTLRRHEYIRVCYGDGTEAFIIERH
jgi:hypothetical protein